MRMASAYLNCSNALEHWNRAGCGYGRWKQKQTSHWPEAWLTLKDSRKQHKTKKTPLKFRDGIWKMKCSIFNFRDMSMYKQHSFPPSCNPHPSEPTNNHPAVLRSCYVMLGYFFPMNHTLQVGSQAGLCRRLWFDPFSRLPCRPGCRTTPQTEISDHKHHVSYLSIYIILYYIILYYIILYYIILY